MEEKKTGDLSTWSFQIEEMSAGVYKVRGIDEAGRSVELTGTDPYILLEKRKKAAAEIIQAVSRDSGSLP